ncbi:MAG: ATP phosphoribosyltransferase [Cytophagales bacterium]|nr:MAG: ATP phosphoribosyltransferase [Cytophagales bacterium]TAF59942.1 MAG: ATP phosphoribosyltransferase [Cytophagales bacterium]
MTPKIRLAIQKSGRLQEASLKLLRECGIRIENVREGQLMVPTQNFPMDLLFLRNADIPRYLEDGVADLGIIGQNLVYEEGNKLPVLKKLGFSKCRLSLAVPNDLDFTHRSWFEGKKIATSYPNSVRQYLDQHKLKAEIHYISGSVEIAPRIGLADAICDIVSTGSTLFQNNLKEVEVMLKSEACLVGSPLMRDELKPLLDKFLFRINASQSSKNNKYVLLNAPNHQIGEITKILPGMKSPTVIPLVAEGWSSVHSVINENDFWEVIDQLKAAGAEGILIVPIEKMIP